MRRRKLLFEIDEGDSSTADSNSKEEFTASGEQEDAVGSSDDAGEDEKDSDSSNDNESGEEENGEKSEEEDTSNEDNEDFNIDSEPDEETSDGEDDSSEDSGTSGGGSSSDDDGGPVDNEDTRRDKEIFDSLSPQEQKQKTNKLKELFLELYSNCNYIIEKFNSSNTSYEELNMQIKKSLSILFNLKQMVSDYVMELFDSKSYMENDIMFNRYLSILNSVKKVTKDIDDILEGGEDENK